MGAIEVMYVGLALFSVPCTLYVFDFLKRLCETIRVNLNRKWIRNIVFAVSIGVGCLCVDIYGIGAVIIFYLLLPQLVMQILNRMLKKLSFGGCTRFETIWKNVYGSGVIPLTVVCMCVIFGYFNMQQVKETDYRISTEKQIREEGYRIALIADTHYGNFHSEEAIGQYCRELSEKELDLVILCGDIVDEKTSKAEMETIIKCLSGITATYGVFFVYGNHDRQEYSAKKSFGEIELEKALEENGITVLKDEVCEVNEDIVLVGREDYTHVKGRASVDSLLEGVDKEKYIIMLDHQPVQCEENESSGTDMLLSGHTHGGQIWPLQYFLQFKYDGEKLWGHRKTSKGMDVIITSGFAGWGVPIKTAAPSEYVIVDMTSN